MNKKDTSILIIFSFWCFLLLSSSALFSSHLNFGYYSEHQKEDQLSQQKFERFVDNVKSGKWQLTPDEWIEVVKHDRIAAKSEYKIIVPIIEHLQFLGWFSLVLGMCNVLAILYVRDNIKKRHNSSQ